MALSPGTHVGEYSVLGLIGVGGMGEVYRARDARLGRDIAIKVLTPSLYEDPAARARFQREARAVAALNHPSIVTIHEVGEHGQQAFIAFEFVSGETLQERLARGPVGVAEALAIALPLAEGLGHAHEHGVVHRDLKPKNIMVRGDGQVKILDFGLGKFLSAPVAQDITTALPSGATETGVVLGTIGYTSPEQLKGHPVDARSDQFAFGAIVYEMLTGRRAFAKETTIQTLNAIIEDEPTPLAALAPGVPRSVAAIVSRCLRKNPEQRYGTTGELVAALRSASDNLRRRTALARWPRLAAAAILSAIVVVGVALAPRIEWRDAFAGRLSPAQGRIVVLPFGNTDGGASAQAFADGLTELLTTRLSGFERENRDLFIVPSTEVRRESVASARDARRVFGASLVVSGSVQWAQNTIRLTLNLTDASTLAQIRGRVIDGQAVDVQTLQDSAVAALAEMLGARSESAVSRLTAASGAYQYYVQGRGYLQRFERLDSVNNAIELFQRSVLGDQQFALGHAALGEAYWRKYELTKDPALVAAARTELAQALEIDRNSPIVRITRAIVARGTGEYETAAAELERAVALDPLSADAFRELGGAYEALKRFDAAEAAFEQAIQVRPDDWSARSAFGGFLIRRARFEEALTHFQRVVELTPDNAAAYSNRGGAQYYLQRYDDAEASFTKSVSIRETQLAWSNLGTVHFIRGRFADAATAFERAAALNPNDFRVWGNLGSAYQWVPDAARARAAYEKAVAVAEADLKVDPRRPAVIADIADYSQALGRRDEARRYAARALELAPDDSSILFKIAVVHEGLGERARALELLATALRAGLRPDQIETARSLAELRRDPRYKQIRVP